MLLQESRLRPGDREAMMVERFGVQFRQCVVKANALNEKTCMTELKDRSGFNHSRIAPFVENNELMLVTHNYMRVFTTEPASQWVEITDLCETIFVNPCWFSEHRVYQFPVHFGPVHSLNPQSRNFVQQVSRGDENFKTCYWIELHRKIGTQCESILEFRLDLVHNERDKLGYF